jgi:hypothetical protein
MKCIYINLDGATRRRDAIEASFHRHARPGFDLQRFAAVDTAAVEQRGIEGRAKPAEKACFASHRDVILGHDPDPAKPLMVLEDDAQFGPTFFQVMTHEAGAGQHDLLFTDICATGVTIMTNLARWRARLEARREVKPYSLAGGEFAGTTAYVVNPRSHGKVKDLLASVAHIDHPLDLQLRGWVRAGKLTAAVTVPFLTTLSPHADASAIQQRSDLDLVLDTFRRMLWIDRSLDDCRPALEEVKAQCCDDDSLMFAPLLCAFASRRLKVK